MDRMTDILSGRSVLVVDDHALVRSLVTEVLKGEGAKVTGVSGGHDAIRQIGQSKWDLVLLDMVMADMDGWEVLDWIDANRPELMHRVVLLTGDRVRANSLRRAGRSQLPIVFKPFALDDLRSAAIDTLYTAELSEQLAQYAA